MGALYAGVQNLLNKAKALDEKITLNADDLSSKVTGYFRNSINLYKSKKSK